MKRDQKIIKVNNYSSNGCFCLEYCRFLFFQENVVVGNTGGGLSRKGRFIDEDGRTRMIVDVLEKTNHSKYMYYAMF